MAKYRNHVKTRDKRYILSQAFDVFFYSIFLVMKKYTHYLMYYKVGIDDKNYF